MESTCFRNGRAPAIPGSPADYSHAVVNGVTAAGSLLDEVLPRFDCHEVHRRFVPAPAERTYAAAKAVTSREIRLLGPLMSARTLPARLRGLRVLGPALRTSVLDQFLR